MNRQKLIAELKQNFMLRRIKAQEENEAFITSLRQNKEFDSLYDAYTKKNLQYLRSIYNQEDISLKHDVEDLKLKIENYLTKLNIDKSKLYPKYKCKICNDTGVAGGRICNCLLSELNQKISFISSTQTNFKSFKDCNEAIMDETDKKASQVISAWCKKYPNIKKININIIGGVGSGKTFLLECMANELINQNHYVAYKTAFELNELARLYHIGKSYEFGDCLKADVLLIDDLGTEPILKNVTKEYLYNLINTRQLNNKPTIITTNLSLDNILDRYGDRIFSRLANKSLSLNICLTSKDKRI